jgi:trigger factor
MRREYRVVFEAGEIDEALDVEAARKATSFRLPGFRPGHVPIHIVRRSLRPDAIKSVLESLVSKACDSIVREAGVSGLAAGPAYRYETPYESGRDVEVTVFVDVAPAFELKPYELKVTEIIPDVREETVDERISSLMKALPLREDAEDGYTVKPLDHVAYKAVCYVDGRESKKRSFQDEMVIPENPTGDVSFILGFVGKRVGEKFEYVTPSNAKLRYEIFIRSIEKTILGATPEEYAEKQGYGELDSLRATTRSVIENEINGSAYLYHKNQVLEALAAQYQFDLPDTIIETEMRSVLAEIRRELKEERHMNPQSEEPFKTDEELREEYIDVVRKRVLLGYVLNKVAMVEGIVATDEELRYAIEAELGKNPVIRSSIIRHYSENPAAITYKRAEIVERKVISFLMSKANTTKIKKTKEEVEAMVEELLKE